MTDEFSNSTIFGSVLEKASDRAEGDSYFRSSVQRWVSEILAEVRVCDIPYISAYDMYKHWKGTVPYFCNQRYFCKLYVEKFLELFRDLEYSGRLAEYILKQDTLFRKVVDRMYDALMRGTLETKSVSTDLARAVAKLYNIEEAYSLDDLGINCKNLYYWNQFVKRLESRRYVGRDSFAYFYDVSADTPWLIIISLPGKSFRGILSHLRRALGNNVGGSMIRLNVLRHYPRTYWRAEAYSLLPSASALFGWHRPTAYYKFNKFFLVSRIAPVENMLDYIADCLVSQWFLAGADVRTMDLWRYLGERRQLVAPSAVFKCWAGVADLKDYFRYDTVGSTKFRIKEGRKYWDDLL